LSDLEASALKAAIATVGIGGWYPRGVARLIDSVAQFHPEMPVFAWVNRTPKGIRPIFQDGYDYTPYEAKPAALAKACEKHDTVILCDASFYAVQPLDPLIDYIEEHGYYLCNNGNVVGEWSSDECLRSYELTRDEAMEIPEISSYCVGVSTDRFTEPCLLTAQWEADSRHAAVIAGHHSNIAVDPHGRNPGFVSDDLRVRGHRHDQTVLSIIAWKLGLNKIVDRPRFTAYKGSETDETVLINQGGAW
jgi:hypothetical protein